MNMNHPSIESGQSNDPEDQQLSSSKLLLLEDTATGINNQNVIRTYLYGEKKELPQYNNNNNNNKRWPLGDPLSRVPAAGASCQARCANVCVCVRAPSVLLCMYYIDNGDVLTSLVPPDDGDELFWNYIVPFFCVKMFSIRMDWKRWWSSTDVKWLQFFLKNCKIVKGIVINVIFCSIIITLYIYRCARSDSHFTFLIRTVSYPFFVRYAGKYKKMTV